MEGEEGTRLQLGDESLQCPNVLKRLAVEEEEEQTDIEPASDRLW